MEMYILPYEVKTLSPVVMISDVGDLNIVRSVDYIKGSAVLGLFACRYLKDKGLTNAHEDPMFYSWFLQGEINFLNAYPKIDLGRSQVQCWPTPLCLMSKKTEKNKVYNIAAKSVQDANKICGQYCNLSGDQIRVVSPRKVLNFHHHRDDRVKGRSVDGSIFYYEALDKDQVFSGALIGSEQSLSQFKESFGSKVRARIGRSRNAQYGLVEFTFDKVNRYEPEDKVNIKIGSEQVTLTFVSPVLLRNESGLPEVSTDILVKHLEHAGLSNFKVCKSFAKFVKVESFVSVWKVKRPAELGLASGSTYVLTFPQGVTDQDKAALMQILAHGIGERRHEGFGRVKVNWVNKDIYGEEPIEIRDPKRPSGEPPALVKKIFNGILVQRLQEIITLKALEEAENYDRLPTNSLLGNLQSLLDHDSILAFRNEINDKTREKREPLDNCMQKRGTSSMLQRLCKDEVPNVANLVRGDNSLEALSKVIRLEVDKELSDELYRYYWRTVFQSMRKLNKEAQRKGAGNDER